MPRQVDQTNRTLQIVYLFFVVLINKISLSYCIDGGDNKWCLLAASLDSFFGNELKPFFDWICLLITSGIRLVFDEVSFLYVGRTLFWQAGAIPSVLF
jgi:hypothetical protein